MLESHRRCYAITTAGCGRARHYRYRRDDVSLRRVRLPTRRSPGGRPGSGRTLHHQPGYPRRTPSVVFSTPNRPAKFAYVCELSGLPGPLGGPYQSRSRPRSPVAHELEERCFHRIFSFAEIHAGSVRRGRRRSPASGGRRGSPETSPGVVQIVSVDRGFPRRGDHLLRPGRHRIGSAKRPAWRIAP